MKKIQVKLNRETVAQLKTIVIIFTASFTLLPLFIYTTSLNTFHFNGHVLLTISTVSSILLIIDIGLIFLNSRFSPLKGLRLRRKLILFTEQLTKQTQDGNLMHSVEWHYQCSDKQTVIELYSRGLVSDTSRLGIQLSEFLNENLLKYEELNNVVYYHFGEFSQRLNGMEILENDEL
ncbi:hypothetical protein [Leuconostoc pseudomesenteroides]|uniref:hypothetical protein n=1 Tax=Leuconostoc pseudomesenteroides TaxID=33968 RepID=UPI00301BB45E